MSFLSLKDQISTFFEQRLDSTRQQLDSLDSDCLIANPTASRLTEALDSLDSLDSSLVARGDSKKPCNIGNIVQEISNNESSYPQIGHYENTVVTHSPTANRYTHLVTCQQCEHLTLTGHCSVKPQYKPLPEAMRDCSSFEAVSGERVAITNAPYSASELNDLLSRYEKKLFDHLLECKQCDFEAARYCAEVFTTGSSYDALLLVFDDAASKREALLNAVIRARISGRSVFVSLDHDNLPTPQQKPVKPLTYGIGDSERPFVNHVMACKQCRPRSALYCADGLQLKANA
jgi:hypothetical protein